MFLAASAAPWFRDSDAGRRLSQGARHLRLLGRGFRPGPRDSSGSTNERGSALSSASRPQRAGHGERRASRYCHMELCRGDGADRQRFLYPSLNSPGRAGPWRDLEKNGGMRGILSPGNPAQPVDSLRSRSHFCSCFTLSALARFALRLLRRRLKVLRANLVRGVVR